MKKLKNTIFIILPVILLMFIFNTTVFAKSSSNTTNNFEVPATILTGLISPSAIALSGDSDDDGIPEIPDFDNDGKLDLAVVNYDANTVSIFLRNIDGTFKDKVDYDTGAGPYSIVAGNFNPGVIPGTDFFLDLAIANANDNTISILLGSGSGTFGTPTVITPADALTPYSITSCDFNNDGNKDLLVANLDSSNVSILIGDGLGGFAEYAPAVPGDPKSPIAIAKRAEPASIATADFDGDGKDDLVVANYGLNSVSLLSDVNLTTTYEYTLRTIDTLGNAFPVGINPISITTGDFNGDGDKDVATANINGGNISVLLGYGNGTFTPAVNYYAGLFPSSITAGDFNGDTNIDLIVTNIDNMMISILYGNGNGRFQYPVTFPTGDYPISSAAGDFNGDAGIDLAVANFNDGTISVLLNTIPVIEVTAPDGGEHIPSGTSVSTYNITWTNLVPVDTYNIYYSCDNGLKFKNKIVTKLPGTENDFDWTVPIPKKGPMRDCLIKVIGYGTDKKIVGWDTSDSTFSIDTVTLTDPNGGETFTAGNTDSDAIKFDIHAMKTPISSLKLFLSSDNGKSWEELYTMDEPSTIASINSTKTGSFEWFVPDRPSAESKMKIEIFSGSKSVGYDISDAVFTINPALAVDDPDGGDIYNIGGSLTVNWTTDTSAAVSYVRVSYSTDNGANWIEKGTVAGNTGTYNFTPIPDFPSDNWLIKVELLDTTGLIVLGSDVNDDVFTVRPLAITYPNGGEPLITQGNPLIITWTTVTAITVGSVKLYYTSDDGATWNLIDTITGSDPGTYSWAAIANDPSANWRIRVELFDSSNVSLGSGISDAVFTVNP
ncbi:MAG: hypothetical protein A2X59_06305 [Nitrospirae bacterium GWC2_42_7]|nr:MAG: hypothetical protein A2X59_06305 [Nitrospirae bacterium GWC2_42_7]